VQESVGRSPVTRDRTDGGGPEISGFGHRTQATAALTRQYERFMLVRAESTALLVQRGREVSDILGTK
jgi:hypothetical protein